VIDVLVDESVEELTVEDNLVDNVFAVCCMFLSVACSVCWTAKEPDGPETFPILESDPAWSDNCFPHRSVSGGRNSLLLFRVVDVLEVVLVSKLGNDRAIVVIGNLEKVGQPFEDDNVEITSDTDCCGSTSGITKFFVVCLDVSVWGGGDEQALDSFLCCVESKQSMLELLFAAAFISVFDGLLDDKDLLLFLMFPLMVELFSSSPKLPMLLLLALPLTLLKGDIDGE
jgi:hypothetical protein